MTVFLMLEAWLKTFGLWLGVMPRWEVMTYRMVNGTPQLPATRLVFWSVADATEAMDELPSFPEQLSLIGYVTHYAVVGDQPAISTQWVGNNLAPKVRELREVAPSFMYPAGLQVVEDCNA